MKMLFDILLGMAAKRILRKFIKLPPKERELILYAIVLILLVVIVIQ